MKYTQRSKENKQSDNKSTLIRSPDIRHTMYRLYNDNFGWHFLFSLSLETKILNNRSHILVI